MYIYIFSVFYVYFKYILVYLCIDIFGYVLSVFWIYSYLFRYILVYSSVF